MLTEIKVESLILTTILSLCKKEIKREFIYFGQIWNSIEKPLAINPNSNFFSYISPQKFSK